MTVSEMRAALLRTWVDITDDWRLVFFAVRQTTDAKDPVGDVIRNAPDEQIQAIYREYLFNLLTR